MIDYHIHTKLCKHADGEISSYVEEAIKLGFSEIAFTDHIPLPDNFDIAHRMSIKELDLYVNWIDRMRSLYPEIIIRLGIEADYYQGFEDFIGKILTSYNFDLVIMSVHFLHHWPEGNWVFDYNFPDKTLSEIYSDYLKTMIQGINTGLFDVVGHVDIIKASGDSFTNQIPDDVDLLLKSILKMNMSLEINTSGYRKPINESYPGYDWLNLINRHQVPLTIGSDAHSPDQIGLNFSQVYQELQSEGIRTLSCYNNRKRFNISLENWGSRTNK